MTKFNATALLQKIRAAANFYNIKTDSREGRVLACAASWIQGHEGEDLPYSWMFQMINCAANLAGEADEGLAAYLCGFFGVSREPDFRRVNMPAHYLNGCPAADWIDYLENVGNLDNAEATEITHEEARRLFADAVGAGILEAMSPEESAEANQLYKSADMASMVMRRQDWIEAVWDTDESLNGDEQAAADYVARQIAEGSLIATNGMPAEINE